MSNRLATLRDLKEKLQKGGLDAAIEKQHSKNKMTARERVDKLFDAGSFVEMGLFVNHRSVDYDMKDKYTPADGVVTGYGQINGRLVYVAAQDYTVLSGSLSEMNADKIVKCQEMAMKVGAPIIYIFDSDGARVEEGINALAGLGKILNNNTTASGVIPQISIIMGLCAGAMAFVPAITDFTFMVDKTSHMFISGPQVISAKAGHDVTEDELGGAATHNEVSGMAHFYASDENECFDQVRTLLSYLPQNNMEKSEVNNSSDDLNRVCSELNDMIAEDNNQVCNMKNVIKVIADDNVFFETQSMFAKNILTGFIHLGTRVVAVVANEPSFNDGLIDIDASDKASRFIRTCDNFNIPVLTLVDAKGFAQSLSEEKRGLIRHAAKMFFAYAEANVPKVTVITGNACGSVYVGMGSKQLGSDIVYAWPSAKISVMNAESAVNILYEKNIKEANNPQVERNNRIAEYNENINNPYVAASRGHIDDIIEPAVTRKMLIAAFDTLETKIVADVRKKHSNIPS